MSWHNQFGKKFAPPAEMERALYAMGFEDHSYGNDVCPRFERNGLGVWIDAENVEDREYDDGKRFVIFRIEGDMGNPVGQIELLATDDVKMALVVLQNTSDEFSTA